MKARTMIAAVAILFMAGAADSQGPMEPPTELKKLDWMVGEWSGKVDWTYMMEAEVPYTVKCEWEGQFLKHTSKMDMMGMMFTETAYYGWDAASKKYRGWTFTNFSPDPRLEAGTLTGDTLVMTSEPWNTGEGELVVGRATITKKGADELHFLLEFKEGETWTKGGEGTFKKKT